MDLSGIPGINPMMEWGGALMNQILGVKPQSELPTYYDYLPTIDIEKFKQDAQILWDKIWTPLSPLLSAGKERGKEIYDSTVDKITPIYREFQAEGGNAIKEAKEVALKAMTNTERFIKENPDEVATGAAMIGGFALIKGANDLAQGKKRGIVETALGTLGLGTAGYIQRETLIQPAIETITPYLAQAKEWVDETLQQTPAITTVTGAVGGSALALGITDLMNGNKKRGIVETIMGLAGISLSLYGLSGEKICPAPEFATCPNLDITQPFVK